MKEKEYLRLRKADKRFYKERDRRYAELALERKEAIKAKDTADEKALDLARKIQNYKDQKANDLREQISSERGTYIDRPSWDAYIKSSDARYHEAMTRIQDQFSDFSNQLGEIRSLDAEQKGEEKAHLEVATTQALTLGRWIAFAAVVVTIIVAVASHIH